MTALLLLPACLPAVVPVVSGPTPAPSETRAAERTAPTSTTTAKPKATTTTSTTTKPTTTTTSSKPTTTTTSTTNTTAPTTSTTPGTAPTHEVERDGSVAGRDNAAGRTVWWTTCNSVVALDDAALDAWAARGVGGFVCMVPRLRGMGGDQEFTGAKTPSGTQFALQRRIEQTQIVSRAGARGMKLYLGFHLSNYYNQSTPLAEWFDDAGWNKILPHLEGAAAAAKRLGFAGLAFDHEIYRQQGNVNKASWKWNFPGNHRGEAAVRAAVAERGRQMMRAMVGQYPGIELAAYAAYVPETWEELVQDKVNGRADARGPEVILDLWNGLTSVEGYGPIRFYDAIFYKTTHLNRSTWDSALAYQANRAMASFSRAFDNWDHAWSRVSVTPFAWVGPGETEFEKPRSVEQVGVQLDVFRRWGMDGEFANYAYNGLGGFDYSPYDPALRSAAQPGTVDSVAPSLEITAQERTGSTARLRGLAADDMAVRAVTWKTSGGATGTGSMIAEPTSGDPITGATWQVRWVAAGIPVGSGPTSVTLTAIDIKGGRTTRTVTLGA